MLVPLSLASSATAQVLADHCNVNADCAWMGAPVDEYCSEYQKCEMPKVGCVLLENGFKGCRPVGGFCPACTSVENKPLTVSPTGRALLLADGSVAVALQISGKPDWVYEVEATGGLLLTNAQEGGSLLVTTPIGDRYVTVVLVAPPTTDVVTLRFLKTTIEPPRFPIDVAIDMGAVRRGATPAHISETAGLAPTFFTRTVGVRNDTAQGTVVVVTVRDASGLRMRRAAIVPASTMVELPNKDFPLSVTVTSGTTTIEAGEATLAPEGATPCSLLVEPMTFTAPSRGSRKLLTVSALACPWTAAVDSPWVTLSDHPSGVNNGSVGYVVAPNLSQSPRTARLRIGDVTHVVTQEGLAPPPPPPSTTHRLYFAEGVVSPNFETRVALFNPTFSTVDATVIFSTSTGKVESRLFTLPGHSRRTVEPRHVGLTNAEFSIVVESSVQLVADRLMTWTTGTQGHGSHMEKAVTSPSSRWYLAEGSTVGRFNLFYLLQNPHPRQVTALVRYLLPSGVPLEKTYALPARSRTTIWVNQETFSSDARSLSSTDVSAVISTPQDSPIVVERAMYLDRPGQVFAAGHESAGVTQPATDWFLAEGATGRFFDLFLLVANPGDILADIETTYLLPDGTTLTKQHRVSANGRYTIWVDHEDSMLADTAVSTTLRSTNGVPLIVERAMWWPGSSEDWYEAHNSAGATAAGPRWALAEGEVGGPRAMDTYILVANTAAALGRVRVTLFLESGFTLTREFDIAARSRLNVDVRAEFPDSVGQRFATLVEAIGPVPASLVVERAMYWSAQGQVWAAGANAIGTPMP